MLRNNILFVMLQMDAGGSERVVLDLARTLDPAEFGIFVAAFKGGQLESDFRGVSDGVYIIEKGAGLDLATMMRLAGIIKRHKIHVINAHHYMPCFYSFPGSSLIHCRKLIYTEHSVPEVTDIARSVHGRLLNLMLYRMAAVVGVSNGIADEFTRAYPAHANKFVTISNGVDIEKFSHRDRGVQVRRRYGMSQEHFVVGMVANFRRVKNHACLIRAAEHLKDEFPLLRIMLVGRGFDGDPEDTEADTRKMILENGLEGRVILAGYQEDIPNVLSAMDAFCLPSFSEGLPVSVLEAMAARVPVIGANVRGIAEIVRNGENGLLFSTDDDVALSRCISEVFENSEFAARLGSTAYRFVSMEHDLRNTCDAYSRLFTT